MENLETFRGIVIAIEEKYKAKNYSIVLERMVTLENNKEAKEMFLLTDETKILQGSYFEFGDTLEVQYDPDSSYPCYFPPRFSAVTMKSDTLYAQRA